MFRNIGHRVFYVRRLGLPIWINIVWGPWTFETKLTFKNRWTITALPIGRGYLRCHPKRIGKVRYTPICFVHIETAEYIMCNPVAIAHHRSRHLEQVHLQPVGVRAIAPKKVFNFFKCLAINWNWTRLRALRTDCIGCGKEQQTIAWSTYKQSNPI